VVVKLIVWRCSQEMIVKLLLTVSVINASHYVYDFMDNSTVVCRTVEIIHLLKLLRNG